MFMVDKVHQQIPQKRPRSCNFGQLHVTFQQFKAPNLRKHKSKIKLPMVRPLARMIIPTKESKPGQLTNLWQYFLQVGNLKGRYTKLTCHLFGGANFQNTLQYHEELLNLTGSRKLYHNSMEFKQN